MTTLSVLPGAAIVIGGIAAAVGSGSDGSSSGRRVLRRVGRPLQGHRLTKTAAPQQSAVDAFKACVKKRSVKTWEAAAHVTKRYTTTSGRRLVSGTS